MDPCQDDKHARMVAAAQKMGQVSLCFVFKHTTKEKSKLQPYGLALVNTKQVVVPSKGSYTFT